MSLHIFMLVLLGVIRIRLLTWKTPRVCNKNWWKINWMCRQDHSVQFFTSTPIGIWCPQAQFQVLHGSAYEKSLQLIRMFPKTHPIVPSFCSTLLSHLQLELFSTLQLIWILPPWVIPSYIVTLILWCLVYTFLLPIPL